MFLCGWTAVNLDFLKEGANSLVDDVRHGRPGAEETGRVCREQWWDYVIEVAEVAVLVVGKLISGDKCIRFGVGFFFFLVIVFCFVFVFLFFFFLGGGNPPPERSFNSS